MIAMRRVKAKEDTPNAADLTAGTASGSLSAVHGNYRYETDLN
jgi:hypothetical protein